MHCIIVKCCCQVRLLDQLPLLIILSKESPHKPTLEGGGDLVECALNILISIAESFTTSFTHSAILLLLLPGVVNKS